MVKNIILTGIPRSGTTLSCKLLNELENVLALVEPLDMEKFMSCADSDSRIEFICDYFSNTRDAIARREPLDLVNIDMLSTNTFQEDDSGNRNTLIKGRASQYISRHLDESFSLIIKHPNAFSALLHELKSHWRCYALVRNPLAVIASWSTLNHPLREGHAPVAEFYDSQLKRKLQSSTTNEMRQVRLLNWYFERFTSELDMSSIFPYENIINSRGNCLSLPIVGAEINFVGLESQNNSKIYNSIKLQKLADLLVATGGAWREIYTDNDIEKLLMDYIS